MYTICEMGFQLQCLVLNARFIISSCMACVERKRQLKEYELVLYEFEIFS